MVNKARISIVIPNYNGAEVLPSLLRSLCAQTYGIECCEVIVVDDGSDDASIAVIRSVMPSAVIVTEKQNKGPAQAKNTGALHASHPWLLFLDTDVTLDSYCLERLMAYAHTSPGVSFQPKIVFTHDPAVINSAGGVMNVYGEAYDRGIYDRDREVYSTDAQMFFGSSATLLVQKEAFITAGMFDKSYFYLYEDVDLGMRLRMQGQLLFYVPDAVCMHKQSYTMGRKNMRVTYLLARNRIMTVVKNYQIKTIIRAGMGMGLRRMQRYVTRVYAGEKTAHYPFAALGAWVWIFVHIPVLFIKRVVIQKKRSVADDVLFSDATETYAHDNNHVNVTSTYE